MNAGGMFAAELEAARGRDGPDRADGARIPRHASCEAPARHADDARPVPAPLLPARVRRPDHGRLRARAAVVARRIRPTSTASCSRRTGLASSRCSNAVRRVPGLEKMQAVRLINGPEAFTPDGEFILRPKPCAATGRGRLPAHRGLAGAGGMGKLVAEWIVEGTPSLDVWHMDSAASAPPTPAGNTLARTTEVYSTYYDVKYPGHEREAGATAAPPAAYARLRGSAPPSARRPAGSRAGLVRGERRRRRRACARARLGQPPLVAGDRRLGAACREAAAVFDESSFMKIEVSRPNATSCSSGSATTASPATSARSPTRRC